MNWFTKIFTPATKATDPAGQVDSARQSLEQQIQVSLEAARYLATCGRFNEEKFDQVESILSKASTGSMSSAERAELKEHVKHLIPDHGVLPWDQVKSKRHQSLSAAVGTYAKLLLELRPDERSRKFVKRSLDQVREIESLIQKSD